MSMIKFSTSSENISSNGGFSFVSGILDSLPEMSLWDRLLAVRCNTRFPHQGIVRGAIGLMTAGCCDFADIEKFSGDAMFRHLVGKDIPSQETFRQRLNQLALADWMPLVDSVASALLRKARLGRISLYGTDYIPLDIDVSVLEDKSSNKEGVAMSYHQVKGYAPIFCYAGTQGHMVADEMRPGSQHSEKGAVEFLRRCVGIMQEAGYEANELLLRVDSGHDSADFIQAAEALGVKYLVKRNPRRENELQLLDSIRSFEEPESPRPGKTVYRGIRSDRKPSGMKEFNGFLVVEGVERTIQADGQCLLIPSVALDSWWTNLPFSVKECVRLYRDHGTSEQFHSELKSDMGVELLPSGSMATNALVLGLATIAFDCLRLIGDAALVPPKKDSDPKRMRLRTVLLDFIKIGCKLVRHANTLVLKVSRCFTYIDALRRVEAIC
ncbi:MAG: IS1380 family transposase [Bacteroidales bacterium]|nr:IS1380 family transposase [Bacteroidales bacterium]